MPLSGITAVRPTANTDFTRVSYGATVAAGNPLYVDSADNLSKLADSNASAATAAAKYIAITPGVSGGFGLVAKGGSIILVGTTMVVGETYYVSQTAGSIIATNELATGDYVTRLGTASSATQLDLAIQATGIQRA